MKKGRRRGYLLLILAASACSCSALIEDANLASDEENADAHRRAARSARSHNTDNDKDAHSRRSRSEENTRYHYENLFSREGSPKATGFHIKQQIDASGDPTPAPVIRDTLNVKPVSSLYAYKTLIQFPERTAKPTPDSSTQAPPTKSAPRKPLPTPAPTPEPSPFPTPDPTAQCGNGVIDGNEECDLGTTFRRGGCHQAFPRRRSLECRDCQCIGCGNGRLDDDEACDRSLENKGLFLAVYAPKMNTAQEDAGVERFQRPHLLRGRHLIRLHCRLLSPLRFPQLLIQPHCRLLSLLRFPQLLIRPHCRLLSPLQFLQLLIRPHCRLLSPLRFLQLLSRPHCRLQDQHN